MIAFIGGLGIGLAVMLLLYRRSRRRWAEQRESESALHQQETATLLDAHARQTAILQQDFAQKLEQTTAQSAADLQRSEAARAQAIFLAATGMKWELASREQLVRACDAAHLDAVIATNIIFTPVESKSLAYCAQVDHLVITERAFLLVDSKRWKGVIFDGVRPSASAPMLEALIDEHTLTESFAVQLSRPDEITAHIDIRFAVGQNAPTWRARKQALRLHNYLCAHSAPVPFIDTCVFYSHPDAIVYSSEPVHNGHAQTLIADSKTITTCLDEACGQDHESLTWAQTARAIEVIRTLGADLVGTGRFADEYRSAVPLEFRIHDGESATTNRGGAGKRTTR